LAYWPRSTPEWRRTGQLRRWLWAGGAGRYLFRNTGRVELRMYGPALPAGLIDSPDRGPQASFTRSA